MDLGKVFMVISYEGEEKLVYFDGVNYIDLNGSFIVDKSLIDWSTLIPYNNVFSDIKKKNSKVKVIERYSIDRRQVIEIKRLVYADIVKNYHTARALGIVKRHVLCAALSHNNYFAVREGHVYEEYNEETNQELCVNNITPLEKEFDEEKSVLSKRKLIEMDYKKEL